MRTILSTTHNLVEGAARWALPLPRKLRRRAFTGKRVGIVFCGGNLDIAVLRRILNREL